MCDVGCSRKVSGEPSATNKPPPSPPSGPKSINQSLERITSKLCSITISECPASNKRLSARISLAMSSKCKPVVGSSNKNKVPLRAVAWRLDDADFAASAKKPANFKRCASPPLRVGTGWPKRTYSKPTSTIGCKARITSRSLANS